MENKYTPTRTSSRLAKKRTSSGKLGCPCCVKRTQTDAVCHSSEHDETQHDKTLNKQIHNTTQQDSNTRLDVSAPVKRKRGRPRKNKTPDGMLESSEHTRIHEKEVRDKCKSGKVTSVTMFGSVSHSRTNLGIDHNNDVTQKRSDLKINKSSADQMIEAMIQLSQDNQKFTDQPQILNAVAAIINNHYVAELERMKTSWEKELTDISPIHLVTYSDRNVIISSNIENIIKAKETLAQMLSQEDRSCFSNSFHGDDEINTNYTSSTSNKSQDEEDKEICDELNVKERDVTSKATLGWAIKHEAADTKEDNMDADTPELVKKAEFSTSVSCSEQQPDTSVSHPTESDCSKDGDPETVVSKEPCQNEVNIFKKTTQTSVNIDSSDLTHEKKTEKDFVENEEVRTCVNIADSSSPKHFKNDEPSTQDVKSDCSMSREDVLKLIDRLEVGLIMEQVDPSEVWKVLAKPYTRSEKTNKKEVTEDDLILCDLCKEYRGTEAAILSHKRRQHPKVIFRCDLCNKAFGLKYACLMHRVSHLGRGRRNQIHQVLRAERQKQETDVKHINMDKLNENIARAGNSTLMKNPERAVHKCKYCDYRGTRVGVTTHTLRYHPKKVYKCNECSKTYGTKYQMDIHKESHIMKYLREARRKKEIKEMLPQMEDGTKICLPDEYKRIHQCDICGFMTTKLALIQHKHRHHQTKVFQCDLCNKWFSRHCEFNSHRASHFDKEGKLRSIRKQTTSEEKDLKQNMDLPNSNADQDASLADSNPDKAVEEGAVTSEPSAPDDSNQNELRIELKQESTTDMQLHSCDVCGFKSTFHHVRIHKIRQHKTGHFECDICCKKFHLNSIMRKHRLTHFTETGELKPWLRRKCGLDKEENLKCEECDIVFKSSRSLEIHVAKKHKKFKKYLCEFCLYRGFTKNDVNVHVARMHKSHDYKCEKCGKAYAFAKELQRHLAVVHQGLEQCKCHICGQEFRMIRYLKNHLERHEGKFRCFCSVCGKGFMDNCRMKEHEQTHKPTDERDHKYQCEICQKGFLRRSTWQQHMNCHYKNRCHSCNICGKAFTLPQTLWKHKLRHKAERPYPCDYPGCTKAFFDKTTYQYHYVTHTGQSAHKCNTCGKVFTQAATLRRHVCKMAFQQFNQDANSAESKESSIGESQTTCPKSDNVISILRSSALSSSNQAVVIHRDQLSLLNQVESPSQVIQVIDNSPSMENVMIILNETSPDSDRTQNLDAPQEAGTLIESDIPEGQRFPDEVEASQLPEMATEAEDTPGVATPQQVAMAQDPADLGMLQDPDTTEASEAVNMESNSEQYLCSICEELFSSWLEIKEHMVLHTGDDSNMVLTVVNPSTQMTTEEIINMQLLSTGGSEDDSEGVMNKD